VGDLEEFGYDSHQDARSDQKEKADLDPYERIYCIVDVRKTGKKIAHKLGVSQKSDVRKIHKKKRVIKGFDPINTQKAFICYEILIFIRFEPLT
jgi:hypothetical protein